MKTEIVARIRILDDQGNVVDETQTQCIDSEFDSCVARITAILQAYKSRVPEPE